MLPDRTRFDIVRYAPAGSVRAVDVDDAGQGDELEGVLYGHFAVFNRWYEIDSMWEGNFLERIAPGTFTQTFAEDTQRCWFEHGYSAFLDRASLGKIEALREDGTGAYYEVRLFNGLPTFFVEGLAAGEYGASFRMRILEEALNADPGVSDHNPKGLPEITIQRVSCPEFGPVSIGASPFATANLRCGTDDFYDAMRSADPDAYARARSAADLTVPVESAPGGAGGGGEEPTTSRALAAASALRLHKEHQ